MLRIGVDEAGRGPVIGPLVVCAIAIPETEISRLESLGVKDSKLLSESKRGELAILLTEYEHSLAIASPAMIDDCENLNLLEVELFAQTISALPNGKVMADACDVDADRFAKRVGEAANRKGVKSEHKADLNHIEVAAASIIAKETREAEMQRVTEEIGFDVGSGYPSDPKTISALPKLLQDETPHPELRWSWKTVRDAWPGPPPKRVGGNNPQKTLF